MEGGGKRERKGISQHVAPDYSRFVNTDMACVASVSAHVHRESWVNKKKKPRRLTQIRFSHFELKILLLFTCKKYVMTCVCTYWYNHSYKRRQKLWISPRLNSCNLTVWGLVITNAECHFQFQTVHSVTHTNRKQGY